MKTPPELSIVIPCYNEANNIDKLFEELTKVLDRLAMEYEIVCVNDGSADKTLEILRQKQKTFPRLKVVDFSRNFGKEAALTAGIDHASGRAVIPFDADLQHPAEVIPELIARWKEGFDVVLARRVDRNTDSTFQRITARFFYRFFNKLSQVKLPADVGDFRLLDRKVIQALATLPERQRFMKGLFAWLGFKQCYVPYVCQERYAGKTKWNGWKLWNFALEGITSFSTLPLRLWSYVGLFTLLCLIALAAYIFLRAFIYGIEVPGYASLMLVTLSLGAFNLIGLGMLGEYIGRIYNEVKQRPIYIVREVIE